ncbi:MAG: ABC transporter permease [Clostridiaceae bacterium]|jgi:spermidine/putrescine transport system permease protein|nr:ABC transporter permease [Clostridiaceae bacterium]
MKKFRYASLPFAVYALIFILAPLILIVFYSFAGPNGGLTLEHYKAFFNFEDPVYLQVLWRSIKVAAVSTLICLALGYPMAYILSKMRPGLRDTMVFLFVLPMWMNFLLRTYAWMTLLERTGLINTLLGKLGLGPLDLMYTQGAVILGNVYNFLPFMILPIYNVLVKIDSSVVEAAQDLGANRFVVFRKVIFPLSLPGVISGVSMTFMPAVSTFIISRLLGGGQQALIGDIIENQFKVVGNWGLGSAMSVALMVLILAAMNVARKYEDENAGGNVLL